MKINIVHIRHCLLYEFHQGAAEAQRTICATYGESVDESTCRIRFRKFRNRDFDLSDKPRSGKPQKVSDAELQELLDQDSSQTKQQLAEKLGITQQAICQKLRELEKIQKHGRWVPHELTQEQRKNQLTRVSHCC